MTTEYTPTVENVTILDEWLACGGHNVSVLPQTTQARHIVNQDTVQRQRPEPPLWRFPTSEGPNYTKERHASILKQITRPYVQCNDGKWYYGYKAERKVFLHDFYPSRPVPTCIFTKLRNKIQEVRVNIGVDVLEIRETHKQFVGYANGVVDAWKHFRTKGRGAKRRRLTPCDVSAAELGMAYGLAPSAGTLYDVVHKLDSVVRVPRIQRVVVTDANEVNFKEDFVDPVYGTWTYSGSQKVSRRVIAYVKYVIDENETGLELGNPATWAWELIPFSFLADWALPVGDYLQALTAMQGVSVAAATKTTVGLFSAEVSHVGSTWNAERLGKVEQIDRTRTVLTDIPMPELPRFQNPALGLKRTLNAIALLTGLSSRHLSPCKYSTVNKR